MALFAALDYSQIELRCVADLSGDQRMTATLCDPDGDIHTDTARLVFRTDKPTGDQRRVAKCFHPDTEVLTRSGWRRILDLYPRDEVVQALPSEGGKVDLEWAVPTSVFTLRHLDKQLVHLKNYGIDLRVTPDHRMLAWQGAQHHLRQKVVTPAELGKQRQWANAGWLPGGRVVDERLLRLAVATEADGSFSGRKIRFGFYNQRKVDQLLELAEEEVKVASYSNGKLRPVTAMTLSAELSRQVRELLTEDKAFPWWWLDLSPPLRRLVLDELPLWDGGRYGRQRQSFYTSGNAQSREVVQALGAVTGIKVTRSPDGSMLHLSTHGYTRGGNLRATAEVFEGEVVCLSVPSTFVLVRDGGVPVVTGQCVNFGIVYDVGPSGLHAQLETANPGAWQLEQCAAMIATHEQEYPGIVRYKAEKRLEARRYGFVRDPWGFRLHVPEVYAHAEYVRAEGERKAINFPVQRGAQTIIRRAMGAVHQYLRTAGLLGSVRPILQVHDELLFEFDSEEVANAQLPVIQALMEGTTALPSGIPIRVTVKRGFSLGAMEEDETA